MLVTSYPSWWQMLAVLSVAVVLSTAVGMERQLRQKSAGMRTHTLVGLGAALFMIVSKYGFSDVLAEGLVTLDPSRVAGQIVSGIGFIGAGLVFVRRNKVRGLTTAASIWLTAAIGTASGAGLILPAVFVTGCHFVIAFAYPVVVRSTRLGKSSQHLLRVRYADGTGALRRIISACTEHGLAVQGFTTRHPDADNGGVLTRLRDNLDTVLPLTGSVEVELELYGTTNMSELVTQLSFLDDVAGVHCDDPPE
ncbi:MgtC/SapB family protein [Rhodococcus sp. NPDC059968]|uniref:MgtC/SapB family protein n=1 Tax=Rhodococcus sp. NPDC059968 TaxID=3347017 RepID=UPI003671D4D8